MPSFGNTMVELDEDGKPQSGKINQNLRHLEIIRHM